MEQIYQSKGKLKKEQVRQAAAMQNLTVPNSSMGALYGIGDSAPDPNLGAVMQRRFQQQFMANQIPAAEAEADRFSSAVPFGLSPEEVKQEMGSRMGVDLSGVRFHTGSEAQKQSDAIGARAYSAGNDVYFGEGGFDSRIAAHELVHTVQQGGNCGTGIPESVSGMGGVTAVASGTVQMMPKFLHGLKAAWSAISGFFGANKPGKKEKKENERRARAGDMSRFLRMGKDKRKQMAQRKEIDLHAMANMGGDIKESVYARYGSGSEAALDPVLRMAMSNISRQGGDRGKQFADAGDQMDQDMMVGTMKKASPAQRQAMVDHFRNFEDEKLLRNEYDIAGSGKAYLGCEGKTMDQRLAAMDRTMVITDEIREAEKNGTKVPTRNQSVSEQLADEALAKGQAAGDSMLNLMFLMQLGKMTKTEEKKVGGKKKDVTGNWDKTMAAAFAHGGRTLFKMGQTKGDVDSMDLLRKSIFSEDAGLEERSAATHYVDDNLQEKQGFDASVSAAMNGFQHYGMDIGIGGVGNKGAMGANGKAQTISADGRSGHLYVGQKNGTQSRSGAFLVGLETESPYKMDQIGKMHDIKAESSDFSSTGGLKQDATGKKTGGRTADLSGLNNDLTADLSSRFKNYASNLRDTDENAYNDLLKQISGKQLSTDALQQLIGNLFAGDIANEEDRGRIAAEIVKQSRQLEQ